MLSMLKHTGLILPAHTSENRVMAIAWSSDGSTLAAALADNTIYTFHCGVMKHLIRVECSNSRLTKRKHLINDIAFSPDSRKLAVAHVRGAVDVHKIENDWTYDVTLCNEFLQNSAVNCLVWSNKGPIVFGLENGKIRASQTETEMVWTLYSTDSSTIAVAINDTGTDILSSHIDGSIFHYKLTSDGSINTANRILTCLATPQVLAWAQEKILVGDRDRQVVFYDDSGKLLKTFDYSQESPPTKSNYACCTSSKLNIAVGLCGKVHLYTWNEKSNFWEEIQSSAMNIVGTVTALALKKDGTKLAIGGLHGVVAEFKLTNTEPIHVSVALSTDKRSRTNSMLIHNVNSNLVSEISLENDNGLPGSTIWPMVDNWKNNSSLESEKYFEKSFDETLRLRKSMNIHKSDKIVKTLMFQSDTKEIDNNSSSTSKLVVVEPTNKSEIVSSFSTWSENNKDKSKKEMPMRDKLSNEQKKSKQIVSDNQIDYISSDIASNSEKSSFTMDFGLIISSDDSENEIDLTMDDNAIASQTFPQSQKRNTKIYRPKSSDLFASTIPTPLTADGMLFQNLNDIPYDPAVDPPCWKTELFGKSRSDITRPFCRNCGRLDVTMKDCPRCKDAYCCWDRQIPDEESSQRVISSPIFFTRQYTPEELRADFTLQLALLASLSPGLQRILEQQMRSEKKDQSC